MKKGETFFYITLILIIVNSCSLIKKENNIIRIVGSDTMYELTKELVKEFNVEYPQIYFSIESGGSKYGIEKFIEGKADICTSSRKLYPDEAKKLVMKFNSLGVAHLVAIDALSVFVNKNNPIQNVSRQELKNIFTGKTQNWQDLNLVKMNIQPVIRNRDSGTYLFFKEFVLDGEEYGKNSLMLNTTNEIINYVEKNENAIGYGGIGYAHNIKIISIDNIQPIRENIINNKYPLLRYLYFFTLNDLDGNLKLFIDWVTSDKGQKVVLKSGYYPLLNIEQ